jgi:hypothetical protein
MTLTVPIRARHDVRALASFLAEHSLPGRRSKTAIARLRRERAGRQYVAPRRLSVQERLVARLVGQAEEEIKRRGGEVVISGQYGDTFLSLWDRDPGQRILLVGAEGWRHYSRSFGARRASLAYLYGMDDSGPWAVRVPGTLRTVAEALAWLEPKDVTDARAAGRRVRRQGDVYAVETTAARDGAGVGDLPDGHRWNPTTRFLTHRPADGRRHRPLRVPFPVRFVRQRAYGMGRGAGRGFGD